MEQTGYDVEVVLDRPRTLRLNWRSLMSFERETKLLVSEVLENGQLGFYTIAAFVWAGLLWQDHGLTLDRTAAILQKWAEDGGDMQKLWVAIQEALRRSKLVSFAEPSTEEKPAANGHDTSGEEGADDPTPAPASGSA